MKPTKELGEIKINFDERIKVYQELMNILQAKLKAYKTIKSFLFFCPFCQTLIKEKIWNLKVEIDAKTRYIVELIARKPEENKAKIISMK